MRGLQANEHSRFAHGLRSGQWLLAWLGLPCRGLGKALPQCFWRKPLCWHSGLLLQQGGGFVPEG